jgi:Fe-S-cluster-containing dehydrogenase component
LPRTGPGQPDRALFEIACTFQVSSKPENFSLNKCKFCYFLITTGFSTLHFCSKIYIKKKKKTRRKKKKKVRQAHEYNTLGAVKYLNLD